MKRKNILAVCGLLACLLLHGCEVKEEMLPEETVPEAIINIVEPLPQGIDINNPDNCTVAVSFEEGDAYVDDTGVICECIIDTVKIFNFFFCKISKFTKSVDTVSVKFFCS